MAHTTEAVELRGSKGKMAAYYDDWRAVYASLLRHGHRRLVDSSKTAGGRRRLDLQLADPSLRPSAIAHLSRTLSEVVVSNAHGNNVQLEFGSGGSASRLVKPRTVAAWLRANRDAARSSRRASVHGIACVQLPYRELLESPEEAVSHLMSLVSWAELPSKNWNHAIAGNRFRRSSWSGEVKAREHRDVQLGFAETALYEAVSGVAKGIRWI